MQGPPGSQVAKGAATRGYAAGFPGARPKRPRVAAFAYPIVQVYSNRRNAISSDVEKRKSDPEIAPDREERRDGRPMTRFLIVEDHPLFREALESAVRLA